MNSRKKVAMVLTGHLRTYKDNFANLKQCILDHYDVDIYISTWDMNSHKSRRLSKLRDMSLDEIENRISIYPNVKAIKVCSTKDAAEMSEADYLLAKKENRSGHWDVANKKYKIFPYHTTLKEIVKISSAWYCVQEGFKLIKNPESYDILMRNRFDILYIKPLEFKDYDFVVSPPSPIKKEGYKVRNYIQYGKPIIITPMSNMYNYVVNTLCRYRNFSSEHMLEYVFDEYFPPYHIDHDYIDLKFYRVNP